MDNMKIQITCKQAVDYISKKEEGKITLWQRIQLKWHLSICSLCKLFAKQNKDVFTQLKNNQPSIQSLSKEEKLQMIESLEKEIL
jgi:predicted transposase YbfD/YdcC